MMKQLFTILVILITFVNYSHADIWLTPEVLFYKSNNEKFELKVTPSVYTSQKLLGKEVQNDSCVGTLYRFEGLDTIIIWTKKLINKDCPLNAIVSNDGKFVVTFNDWYGSSINAVVIYNSEGDLIRKFGLYDIVPREIYFSMSNTQVFWGGSHEFSRNNLELILEISAIRSISEKNNKYIPIKIKLKDGILIQNKKIERLIRRQKTLF